LPPDVESWGTASYSDVDFSDFAKASRDVYYNFVSPFTERLIDDDGPMWTRFRDLDGFAASLVGHHKAMEKLQVRVDSSNTWDNAMKDETHVVDGCTARHLGAGVIALELPSNPIDREAARRYTGPVVLSRRNSREIVVKTIDLLGAGYSAYVIGKAGE
jgi:hypothetical protein